MFLRVLKIELENIKELYNPVKVKQNFSFVSSNHT